MDGPNHPPRAEFDSRRRLQSHRRPGDRGLEQRPDALAERCVVTDLATRSCSAQRDPRAGGASRQIRHDPGPRDARDVRDPQRLELLRDPRHRVVLGERQLRTAVEIPTPGVPAWSGRSGEARTHYAPGHIEQGHSFGGAFINDLSGGDALYRAVADAQGVVVAVPSQAFREVTRPLGNFSGVIVSVTKGIEYNTGLTMCGILGENASRARRT